MIHQLKSWLRTTYSWISPFNVNRYLDEFCYKLNRRYFGDKLFDRLTIAMSDNYWYNNE